MLFVRLGLLLLALGCPAPAAEISPEMESPEEAAARERLQATLKIDVLKARHGKSLPPEAVEELRQIGRTHWPALSRELKAELRSYFSPEEIDALDSGPAAPRYSVELATPPPQALVEARLPLPLPAPPARPTVAFEEYAEISATAFQIFLNDAAYGRQAKQMIELIADFAPAAQRRAALGALMRLAPPILLDSRRSQTSLRSRTLLPPQDPPPVGKTQIVINSGPAVAARRTMFFAAGEMLLPEDPPPPAKSRRLSFSTEQMAGSLLAELTLLDSKLRGLPPAAAEARRRAREAQMAFYGELQRRGKPPKLDGELSAQFADWSRRPHDDADFLAQTEPAQGGSPEPHRAGTFQNRVFSAELPSDWQVVEEEAPYGTVARFLGPPEAGGAYRAALHVHFIEKGRKGFMPFEEALKRERQSVDEVERSAGSVQRRPVNRRASRRFEITEKRLLPLDRLPASWFWLHHYYAMVPAESGYFILKLSSLRDTYLDYRPDFERFLNSFRAL